MVARRINLRKKTTEEPKEPKNPIVLRKLVSGQPLEQHLRELEENLERMGCKCLLGVPWSFKDKSLIREVLSGAPNQFEHSLRCDPSHWTKDKWQAVYGLGIQGGAGMAFRKDDFVQGKFAHNVDPKDGFPISDCVVEWERRVLEFIVPILYPEKPNRVTITLGNTIFGSLSGERPVD
jgi:hypothetical protein